MDQRQRALPRARGHLGATVRELVERLGRMEGVPLATRVVANGAMGFVVHMVKEMCGFLGNLSFDQHVNTGYVLFKGTWVNHIFLQGHKKLNSLLAGSEMVFQLVT
ncbi:hypothetical protein CFC21_079770 [Triticum aestivum]|uniref:Uncharacterized protein n=4 Tax=Triticinae TaxID=1648030 RepID=A0A453LXE8_AEGTS|nr:hypothetical protein CFC21_079770 [Triticum aestivum]